MSVHIYAKSCAGNPSIQKTSPEGRTNNNVLRYGNDKDNIPDKTRRWRTTTSSYTFEPAFTFETICRSEGASAI